MADTPVVSPTPIQTPHKFDPEHVPPTGRRKVVGPAFKSVFQFARYMITLPIALVRGRRGKIDEVTVYSAHPSFFLWLLIAVGFVAAAVVNHYPDQIRIGSATQGLRIKSSEHWG